MLLAPLTPQRKSKLVGDYFFEIVSGSEVIHRTRPCTNKNLKALKPMQRAAMYVRAFRASQNAKSARYFRKCAFVWHFNCLQKAYPALCFFTDLCRPLQNLAKRRTRARASPSCNYCLRPSPHRTLTRGFGL